MDENPIRPDLPLTKISKDFYVTPALVTPTDRFKVEVSISYRTFIIVNEIRKNYLIVYQQRYNAINIFILGDWESESNGSHYKAYREDSHHAPGTTNK